LSDRRAAEAVRSRIDWKYLLGLELTDPGFDASVLSEFRGRLVAGRAEQLLLDTLLTLCRERKLLRPRGRQRTDSTHVPGAVRGHAARLCRAGRPGWALPPRGRDGPRGANLAARGSGRRTVAAGLGAELLPRSGRGGSGPHPWRTRPGRAPGALAGRGRGLP